MYAQRFFRDDHRKIARAGRNVAGADADGVRRGHAGARVALAGREGDAAAQRAGGIEEACAALGERARPHAGRHDLRQNFAQLDSRELAEFYKHRLVIVTRRAVDREHAGGLAHTHQLFAGEQKMQIARERREIVDPAHMLLTVQDRLVEVGDAPALWDVEIEERRQLFGGLAGDRVAPGAERGELIALAVKGKIAVHHRGNADRADCRKLEIILLLHVAAQRGKAVLHADAHVLQRIGPDPVDQAVFPLPVAGSDGNMLLVDQNSLDTGRAQLKPEYGFLQIQFCYLRFLCHRRNYVISFSLPFFPLSVEPVQNGADLPDIAGVVVRGFQDKRKGRERGMQRDPAQRLEPKLPLAELFVPVLV